MKKIGLLGFLFCLPFFSFGDLVLVQDGQPNGAIILEEQATAASQMGAFELNYFLQKISGCTLPILSAKEPCSAEVQIKICRDATVVSGEFFSVKWDENVIELSGNDSGDFRKVDYGDATTFPNYKYAYNGSLWAVYDFLETALNVRFYGYDDLSTTFTPRKTVVLKPYRKTYTPPLDAFRMISVGTSLEKAFKLTKRDISLFRLRWRQTSFFGRTNHNSYSIYFAHWGRAKRPGLADAFISEKHDLFAKGYAGRDGSGDPILRSNFPGDVDCPSHLCFSNPDTVKYYAKEALTYFNGQNVKGGWHNFSGNIPTSQCLIPRFPNKPFFYPFEGSDNGKYCLCESCQKRLGKNGDENVSNNKFQFIADIANEIGKTDKRAGISTLSYIQSAPYPDKVTLPDNVSVQLCLTVYAWWHPVAYQIQHSNYKKWIEKEASKRPLTLWTYLFGSNWDANHHYGKYDPFPTLYPWQVGKMFKEFTGDKIRGWFSETEPDYTLETYVANRIAFNPAEDPNALIDEFFTNFYGEAGVFMKEFYKEVEQSFFNPENAEKSWLKNPNKLVGPKGEKHPHWGTGLLSPQINWGKAGNPKRMAKLKELMAKAEAAVKTAEEKARLKQFREIVWDKALRGEAEYLKMQKRLETPPKLLELKKSGEFNGDLSKVPWAESALAEGWGDLIGNAVPNAAKMAVLMDSTHLYLKYADDFKPCPERDLWRENVELFFASTAPGNIVHLAISPSGAMEGNLHVAQKDKYVTERKDFQAVLKNRPDENKWEFEVAIPLKSLDMTSAGGLQANFIRTRREGAVSWIPIFSSAYRDGFKHLGRLGFFPVTLTADNFTYISKGKFTHKVQDPAANNREVGVLHTDSGWSLQCPVPFYFSASRRYEVTVRVRGSIVKEMEDQTIAFGFHNAKQRKVVGNRRITLADINGETYKEIKIGTYRLSPDMFLYVGGTAGKNPQNKVYLESVTFTLKQ